MLIFLKLTCSYSASQLVPFPQSSGPSFPCQLGLFPQLTGPYFPSQLVPISQVNWSPFPQSTGPFSPSQLATIAVVSSPLIPIFPVNWSPSPLLPLLDPSSTGGLFPRARSANPQSPPEHRHMRTQVGNLFSMLQSGLLIIFSLLPSFVKIPHSCKWFICHYKSWLRFASSFPELGSTSHSGKR